MPAPIKGKMMIKAVTYQFIARDIQKMIEEVTRELLLYGGRKPLDRSSGFFKKIIKDQLSFFKNC